MPALTLDVALVHQNRADAAGNAQFLGPDLYFDDLMCQAASARSSPASGSSTTADFATNGSHHTQRISRLWTDGVVETPNGAHFTSCTPDYERDEAFQKEYAARGRIAEAWQQWRADWIDISEADYQRKVARAMTPHRDPRGHLLRRGGGVLPRRRRDRRQPDRHDPADRWAAGASLVRARPRHDRRRGDAHRRRRATSRRGTRTARCSTSSGPAAAT